MTRLLHSNLMFAISVCVLGAWAWQFIPWRVHLHVTECPYRVSNAGRVHPHWSVWYPMTSPDPCFNTRDAAERFAKKVRGNG